MLFLHNTKGVMFKLCLSIPAVVAVSVAAVVVVIPVSALIFATIALLIYREALINNII